MTDPFDLGADDLGFELLPADDVQSADDRIEAAAAAALASTRPEDPADEDESIAPLGYSWAFDWAAGRFIRQGSAPARVSGLDALRERCMMALNSARFAHPVFSSSFGMDRPQGDVGTLMTDYMVADFERRLRECLMSVEGVSDVQDVMVTADPTQGVLRFRFTVVNDEEVELPFSDLQLALDGGL